MPAGFKHGPTKDVSKFLAFREGWTGGTLEPLRAFCRISTVLLNRPPVSGMPTSAVTFRNVGAVQRRCGEVGRVAEPAAHAGSGRSGRPEPDGSRQVGY